MPKTDKPNILILWGDDIGWWNISYNSRGQMGYRTPNIDRVANEGVAFTDYYGQQSCTAGRAAFITGQNPIRTGLTKVGMPGADVGLHAEDPTIAELLKPLGYVTGQFGKNHLGDKDQFLPTMHGFDEFFGNLYHLQARRARHQRGHDRHVLDRQRRPLQLMAGRRHHAVPVRKKRQLGARLARAGVRWWQARSPSFRSSRRGRSQPPSTSMRS
jgi:arylsulfatase A-like enzyme